MFHFSRFIRLVCAAAVALCSIAKADTVQAAVRPQFAASVPSTSNWIVHNVAALNARRVHRAGIQTTPNPIDGPFGLTVAPSGDLYIANMLGNNVLVYGSNLVQKSTSAFSAGLTYPTSVAFDSAGEVFVSNVSPSSVNVYSPSHALLPSRTLTALVNYPMSIAIDGLDNLYVDDNTASITAYSYNGLFLGSILNSFLQISYAAMAQHGHLSAFAGNGLIIYTATNAALDDAQYNTPNDAFLATEVAYDRPSSVAFDANENLYVATNDPAIYYFDTTTHQGRRIVPLGFVPQAIAVDSAHNHLFVADFRDSAVQVYTLSGTFITTLK